MKNLMQITGIMNAAEIIDQIKQLPLEEQGKVVDFARHLPNAETLAAMAEPVDTSRSFNSVKELFAELDKEC
jgi:hypothetical protein